MENMDSVFSNCTDKELAFDVMFDQDDALIDIVAGVNEAGEFVTGEDPEININEEDDMVGENPDFDYHDDNKNVTLKDAEGTEDVKPEIGGEVGDGKEVSGKEDSAEKKADEVTKDIDDAIGANDNQQTALEDAAEGALEDDDEAERAGEVPADVVPTVAEDECGTACAESAVEDEEDPIMEAFFRNINKSINSIVEEAENNKLCPCCGQEYCDCAERMGEVKHDTDNVEGKSTEVLGAEVSGDAKVDPIEDKDDAEVRSGEEKIDDKNVDGEKVEVIGAALESDDILADVDDDDSLLKLILADKDCADDVIPDSIKVEDSANKIDIAKEAAEEEAAVEDIDDIDEDDIIDIVNNDSAADDENVDIEAGYDDDELIDLVISDKTE